jgi:phage tail-like protein
MATVRDDPYTGFAFLVSLGGDSSGPAAGFSRVSGLDQEVELLTYRAGNDRTSASRLVPGLVVNPTLTLERGLVGSLDLQEWIRTVTNEGAAAARDLAVDLLGEDRSPVYRWLVRGAVPTALRGPTLDANRSALAIETLVLRAVSVTAE